MLSMSGLVSLSQTCPYLLVNENPDAHPANSRKIAKSSLGLPKNCFHVGGKCGAHQVQRVIELNEEPILGDVHAIAFSGACPSLQNKFQAGLKRVLQSLVYVRGQPDPHQAQQHELIIKHTMRRKSSCVAGDPDAPGLVELDEHARCFLKYWNSDWSSPTIVHVCPGCCDGPEEAQQNLFAAAVGIDILQSRECDIPCKDDWGTCGMACGKTSTGILCHGLLAQVFEASLPDWAAMLPDGVDDEEQDDINGQPARQKVQKKAWRSKYVLRDEQKKLSIVMMCWLGAPLERLSAELQWLDEKGKGLYDVICDNDLNPFFACRRKLAELVADGPTGPMKPVFDTYPGHMHTMMMDKLRGLGLDFGSQVFWRFLPYTGFPYLWARMVHPGISKASQDEVADYFFDAQKDCCRHRGFCSKVAQIFPDAQSLRQDARFRRLLVTWACSYSFTDMYTERLLAQIRKSTDDDDVDVERVCSNGFLTQFMQEHRRKGFSDVVGKTRLPLETSSYQFQQQQQ